MITQRHLSYVRTLLGIIHGSRAFGGPFQVLLTLTNRCNNRCIHCIFHSPFLERPNLEPSRKARLMSLPFPNNEDLRRIQKLEIDPKRTSALIDEVVRMGTRRFQFSANGEPFLHKNALEFMGRAKHSGCTCVVNTNGTLLKREVMDELIGMRFDELQITTMAGSAKVYCLTHPGSEEEDFHRIASNLLYLAERKRALGLRQPKVTLCNVVISQNHKDLVEFAGFASHVHAERVLIRAFFNVEDESLSSMVLGPEEISRVLEQMTKVRLLLDSAGIEHNATNFLSVFKGKLDTSELYRNIPCYYGWLSSRVEVDGEIYPCCRCHVPLGNIHHSNFNDIWHSEAYTSFRKSALKINRLATPIAGCACDQCANFNANLSVYELLHPVKRRSFGR